MTTRVRGWAKVKTAVRLLCKVLGAYFASIEPRIQNPQHRQRFENLRLAVEAFCAIIDLIDFVGDGVGQA